MCCTRSVMRNGRSGKWRIVSAGPLLQWEQLPYLLGYHPSIWYRLAGPVVLNARTINVDTLND
ncbi:MAG: hypothetical protein R3C28_28525 [Pirellulaceae bacterium]